MTIATATEAGERVTSTVDFDQFVNARSSGLDSRHEPVLDVNRAPDDQPVLVLAGVTGASRDVTYELIADGQEVLNSAGGGHWLTPVGPFYAGKHTVALEASDASGPDTEIGFAIYERVG